MTSVPQAVPDAGGRSVNDLDDSIFVLRMPPMMGCGSTSTRSADQSFGLIRQRDEG